MALNVIQIRGMMAPYMKTPRNREKKYTVTINARVADRHLAVINAYMEKYDISKTEAIRMIIDASARYLFDDE